MTAITATDLHFRYPAQPHWALRGLSLECLPGQITWLTGALGSGTSTTLLALAGLAPRLTGGERSGEVTIDGVDPATVGPISHGIAYLGPTPALQLSGIARNVADEIAIGPMNLYWPIEQLRDAVDRTLAELEIDHLRDRAPNALSGGEQQRVLLAALAATAPKTWLLDEPFSALDRRGRETVTAWLRDLARRGASVVIACDDADLMLPLADRVLLFRDGAIVAEGSPEILLAGDAFLDAGATTTEAATLAAAAHFVVPRPLTTAALLSALPVMQAVPVDPVLPRPDPTTAPLLCCRDVHFAYPDGPPVLAGVVLEVRPGEAVGLFGANGAGKSTLLRLAMALDHPTRGTITTLGRPTSGHHPEDFAPEVGFLFQQPERQLFAASVRSECSLGPRLAGWETARIADAVAGVLEELGLVDAIDVHPYDLPLPRRRLVALAATLVTEPRLLLLDEPTAALDGRSRDLVVRAIRHRVSRGGAIVAITHDVAFAHEALDLGVRLRDGRVEAVASMRQVLSESGDPVPATLAVALRLGAQPGADRRHDIAHLLRAGRRH